MTFNFLECFTEAYTIFVMLLNVGVILANAPQLPKNFQTLVIMNFILLGLMGQSNNAE